MKKFEIPSHYRSSFITRIKNNRKQFDPRKNDFTPAELDFGPIRFFIARHFGFCYGVENAIEIAYKTIEENHGKKIFLLSEMIHNPGVNDDLVKMGVRFITDTDGKQLIDWNEIAKDDIVMIPAFGTTFEIENKLNSIGIDPYRYNTTCPFVEKVWNRSSQLGGENFTVIIHGKSYHEETRATFSHSVTGAPSLIVKDLNETTFLAEVILGSKTHKDFYDFFNGKYSEGFSVENDLLKLGVVNQTTMLASETQQIADHLKETMLKKFGAENITEHFADTRDTLCYATNDNQDATYGLLKTPADFAIVVGGYNSSNTGHLVELCEEKLKTYFISSDRKIISEEEILHYNLHQNIEITTNDFLPHKEKIDILITSGASCPDAIVEMVIKKLLTFYNKSRSVEEVVDELLTEI